MINATLRDVTERIEARSRDSRKDYCDRMEAAARGGPHRLTLSCGNLAHGFAACPAQEKQDLSGRQKPNLAIVSSYNDMLSAHQPLGEYPALLKGAAFEAGAVAQFAGGVPAMCDGVTQGQAGMELSLFSRDIIAQSTAIALSHNMFDGALCLGVCDKIVPGLLMGALAFGHLPTLFVPAGPMTSGLPNSEKARIRQLYAEGKVGREELLRAEAESYHGPGTCTFYGTANSNQMLMEIMGLHVPGSAFVNPGTPLRTAITRAAAQRLAEVTALGNDYRPLYRLVNARALTNAIVGLMATGGSTNHTIHLVAIARVAGLAIDWQDFADISRVTPLMARIYPNGSADVNHFQAAGGLGFVIRELIEAGLLWPEVETMFGDGLNRYAGEARLNGDELAWAPPPKESLDRDVLRSLSDPFSHEGGIRLLTGNLGRAVIKVSAVKPTHRTVRAPAAVFADQDDVVAAFKEGQLDRDVIVVVRHQGPAANGMPELHKLTPALSVLLDRGHKVALVTDGRMSGASGKVAAALHVTPDAFHDGVLAKVRDGDIIHLDAEKGLLEVELDDAALAARPSAPFDLGRNQWGMGRELFAGARRLASSAETGAMTIFGG
ncbi:MAG TPA: phosphogluconate dehydratase [Dongiaceae bacterium]|nr:phosphogluconate dehydratase [Dongiaceae bacterium]